MCYTYVHHIMRNGEVYERLLSGQKLSQLIERSLLPYTDSYSMYYATTSKRSAFFVNYNLR